jgi:ATP-dependent Clp protease ATP-binding subunit ClpC
MRSPDAFLDRFTRDLTADARAGRLEPVRARAAEIERVTDILLRHGKNNPALVGPAGVGKTAIVEGLAQRMAAGDVPLVLRDVRLLAVDHVALLAGTTYRGQYEERIQALVDETRADPNLILFIDELHNLMGQGTAMGVAMDAANMLKPALVRGDFRVIGATTDDEYERWICADPALERRFQKVDVRELSAEETLDVLHSRVQRLERHHNVVIAEEAVRAAIELTDEWMTDRHRPDRAIDVLDEACAHAQATARYSPATERLVLERRNLLRAGADAPLPPEPEPVSAAHLADEESGGAPSATREAPESAKAGARAEGQASADATGNGAEPYPLDRMARDGMKALERFGAELEALFASGPETEGGAEQNEAALRARTRARAAAAAAAERRTNPTLVADRARLAALDTELARRFMEEGLVVRGHDVARVVAHVVGTEVRWHE